MGIIKERSWFILLGSGILTIVAMFIPSIQLLTNYEFYSWVCGLYYSTETGLGFGGIGFITILVPLSAVLLLLAGLKNKKTNTHNLDILGLIGGVTLIFVAIWRFIAVISYRITVIDIPIYVILIAGVLGMLVGLIGFKEKSFKVEVLQSD
ncbi:MAG: hypothetical protein ACFFB0_05425 [Promethearchaeota archaeon]